MQFQLRAVEHFVNLYRRRQAWVYHRRTCEFHEYHAAALNPDLVLDPNYWRANFRIGKDTFDYLCETVYNYVVKDETQLRETIPVTKRIAISL